VVESKAVVDKAQMRYVVEKEEQFFLLQNNKVKHWTKTDENKQNQGEQVGKRKWRARWMN
jgi:hypothetical protein